MKALLGSLLVLSLAISACSRRNDGERLATTSSSGITITMRIQPECQTNTATVSLTAPHSNQSYNTQSVPNGGSAFFQINPGNYVLSANTTTGCQVSQAIQTVANDTVPYQICLGNTCGTGSYKTLAKASSNGVPCAWGVYGCLGHMFPGAGNIGVGKPNIYFTVKENTELSLDLEFAAGNNVLAAIPTLGMTGWHAQIRPNGMIRVGEANYEYLFYDAQIDENKLQFSDGFCASRDQILGRMTEYLSLVGFSERATTEFSRHWQGHLPPNPVLCAYPQDESRIGQVVAYKSSTRFASKRLWFILIPQLEDAVSRIRPIPTNLSIAAAKPKSDALVAAKKSAINRRVANEADILAEEWGIGFLLER